jgi:hypothetical protein
MSQIPVSRQIEDLEREIQELEASLPAHSIPPTMLIRLEELEDELARLWREAASESDQKPHLAP